MDLTFEKQLNNQSLVSLIEDFSSTVELSKISSELSKNLPLTKSIAPLCKRLTLNDLEYLILPGLCDVHVHFREPGFSYKETVKTGSLSAARGGYTAVCTMPNLNPVPDTLENLGVQLDLIERDAVVNVYPYAAITLGEQGKTLVDFSALAPHVRAFSDDGRGVQNGNLMLEAMQKVKELDKVISAHCEDNSLLFGGYIHDGEYAKKNGHKGICSASEYKQIERDLSLAKKTGVKYHVCHISTKESVELIRQAKAQGVNVTCETAPHYLIMTDADLKEDGNYKMNPPVRALEDKLALIEGIKDGTIDMIATDHAPHSQSEKSNGLKNSPFGIVGLETAFALLYTHLVKPGVITLERLIELTVLAPRARFNIPLGRDFTVFEIAKQYEINSNDFASMGKNTPFNSHKVYGKCVLTVKDGKIIYQV